MRNLLTLFVLLLIGIGYSFAQGVPGIVTEGIQPLTGAIIKNKKSKEFAVSDVKGNFHIKAANGDSLITTFIGYKNDTLIFNKYVFLNINLHQLPHPLTEVDIHDKRLTPLQKFEQNKADYKQIYRIGDDKNAFGFGGGIEGILLTINIDKLYSKFSKEGKDARKLQKTLVNDYHADIVNSRFTDSLVTRITGLKGEKLDDFMINNRPSYEFITQASEYDLISYIRRRANGIVLAN